MLEIVNKSVEELIPYANNARTHSEEQVIQIAASIKEFGFNNPILLDGENGVVAGHGRLLAAKKLGLKTVPCIELGHLTEAKKKAYILADNKIALNSGWNNELLNIELEELRDEDIDLNLIGFSDAELDEISKEFTEEEKPFTDEETDEIPEEVETKCKLGDLWQLGEHRLMCGDSTDEECFKKLMNGEIADMVFTSPPYNGNNKISDGDVFSLKGKRGAQKLYNNGYSDDLSSDKYIAFTQKVLENCFKFTNGFIFWNVNYNSNSKFEYIAQIVPFLPYLIEQICWKKTSAIPLKGCMRRAWEPIYVFSTEKKNLGLKEVKTNFWDISNTDSQIADHKACFPVNLPREGISLVEPKSNIVLEPFGGSGSTLIACEQTKRKARLMELDPHYCDVIIQRWENLTGKKAVLING